MRIHFVFLLLAVAVLAQPVRAQSGHGTLRGIVLQEHPEHPNVPSTWGLLYEGLTDSTYVSGSPYVKLTPIEAHLDPDPVQIRATGTYGRYDFGVIPMGLYLLRVEAPGFHPWVAEILVPSDSRNEIHVLLHAIK